MMHHQNPPENPNFQQKHQIYCIRNAHKKISNISGEADSDEGLMMLGGILGAANLDIYHSSC